MPEITIEVDRDIKYNEFVSKSVPEEVKINKETGYNKININVVDENEIFSKLKGIGRVKAKRIIEYRQKYGSFSNIQEIKNVKGIGDKVFEKIKDLIIV